MSKTRKIVICIDNLKTFEEKHTQNDFLREEITGHDVTLLHVFEKTFYNDEFSEYSWPPQEKFPEIEEKVLKRLDTIGEPLKDISNSLTSRCIFSEEARVAATHFLNDQDSDMVVVFSRGLSELEELFLSSMTEHLVRNTKCPVLVLRENK